MGGGLSNLASGLGGAGSVLNGVSSVSGSFDAATDAGGNWVKNFMTYPSYPGMPTMPPMLTSATFSKSTNDGNGNSESVNFNWTPESIFNPGGNATWHASIGRSKRDPLTDGYRISSFSAMVDKSTAYDPNISVFGSGSIVEYDSNGVLKSSFNGMFSAPNGQLTDSVGYLMFDRFVDELHEHLYVHSMGTNTFKVSGGLSDPNKVFNVDYSFTNGLSDLSARGKILNPDSSFDVSVFVDDNVLKGIRASGNVVRPGAVYSFGATHVPGLGTRLEASGIRELAPNDYLHVYMLTDPTIPTLAAGLQLSKHWVTPRADISALFSTELQNIGPGPLQYQTFLGVQIQAPPKIRFMQSPFLPYWVTPNFTADPFFSWPR
jgi:hypothetical protein